MHSRRLFDRTAASWIHVLVLLAAAVTIVALGMQTLLRSVSEWQSVYVQGGAQFIAGQDFYLSGIGYAYPPFAAMLAAPLSMLPQWISRLAWFAASAAAMMVMVVAAWRLANGVPLSRIGSANRRELYAFLCGLALSAGFILNAFAHQQTDVLIGGLTLGGALVLRRGKVSGGLLIGLAAAFKATPLLWAPYLMWRRRYIAGALVVVVAVGVNVIPDLIAPAPGGGLWLRHWFDYFIAPTQRLDAAVGLWASAIEFNQSLSGTLGRVVNTKLVLTPAPHLVSRPLLEPVTLKAIVYPLFAMLIAVSMFVSARFCGRKVGEASLPDRVGYEFSLVLILMLLLSPMSGRPHFGILILPVFCLARLAFLTGDRAATAILALAALLVVPPYRDLVSASVHSMLLWGGATTAATVLIWIGCIGVLLRGQYAEARAQDGAAHEHFPARQNRLADRKCSKFKGLSKS